MTRLLTDAETLVARTVPVDGPVDLLAVAQEHLERVDPDAFDRLRAL